MFITAVKKPVLMINPIHVNAHAPIHIGYF